MEKLDRLVWAAGFAFSAYGVRFGIRVNDLSILSRLKDYLPPGNKPSVSSIVDDLYSLIVGGSGLNSRIRRFNMLYRGAGRLARTLDLDELLDVFESDLHFVVASTAKDRLFVHAGVVAWNKRAIVIPGRSLSGKTSLVQALARAGATYYSDEYAVLDSRGRVHPYPKPLSIRQEADARPKRCPIELLGGHSGTEPLPIGLIVVTQYQPGAQWRPRVLSAGQATLALLDNTVLARFQTQLALSIFQRTTPKVLTLKSKRGEAQSIASTLLSYMG